MPASPQPSTWLRDTTNAAVAHPALSWVSVVGETVRYIAAKPADVRASRVVYGCIPGSVLQVLVRLANLCGS